LHGIDHRASEDALLVRLAPVLADLSPGSMFPDLELPDHNGVLRTVSELAEGEVAYTRLVSVSIDAPVTRSAFRAGLDARWTFLSDHERRYGGALRQGAIRSATGIGLEAGNCGSRRSSAMRPSARPTISSSSSAGTGRENKNPCPLEHPIDRSMAS
jgi:hypothetical protein